MKKRTKITAVSLAALTLLTAFGVTFSALAADNSTDSGVKQFFGRHFGPKADMTTEEQQAWEEQRTARQEAMDAQRDAVEAALTAGDYQAWVAAVGDNSPWLEKINEDNFPVLVEAHQLMAEARSKMESLGLEPQTGRGHGEPGPMMMPQEPQSN